MLDRLMEDASVMGRDGVGDGGEATKAAVLSEVQRLVDSERETFERVCDDVANDFMRFDNVTADEIKARIRARSDLPRDALGADNAS